MKEPRSRRSGIALIAALSLLALLGLLIAGAVASTAVAQRTTRLTAVEGATSSASDLALATVLSQPDAYTLADAPLGLPRSFAIPGASGGISTTVTVTRLPRGVMWLVADASFDGVDQGHRRLGLVARFAGIGNLPAAGVVVRGSATLAAARTSIDSSGDAECVRPDAQPVASSADSAAFYLLAWQAAVLDSAPGVVHVRGDTTIAGGTFTGILVVDGAITVTGGWSATGLVVARGPVQASAPIDVTGALMSFASGTSVALTEGSIRFAPCRVAREIRRAIPPRAVPGRAWAELF